MALNYQSLINVEHVDEFMKALGGYAVPFTTLPPPGNFQQTASHDSGLTAAMNAGFNAGIMAVAMRSAQ